MLYNLRTVLALINNTTTKSGLKCVAELDDRFYETGKKITEEEYEAINITYLKSPNGVETGLAYIIDGTGKDTKYLDKEPLTVFDIKHNIDLSKEEKENLKKQRAEEKQANKQNTKTKNKSAGKPRYAKADIPA